jgi:hypothetical protein
MYTLHTRPHTCTHTNDIMCTLTLDDLLFSLSVWAGAGDVGGWPEACGSGHERPHDD